MIENTVKTSAKSFLIPHNPATLFKAHFKSVFPSPLKIENFEDQKPQAENMLCWLGDWLTRPDLGLAWCGCTSYSFLGLH